ncbi:hypothetical protein, partial [Klebsiella pneumoniae]|uniref:hypothetical protein n=1 Tax=Klebsiella pneumoniae TaxID=573 RepID=UPI002ED2B33A|nr:hypothetical protein [Klebsiella pneumoniae]
ADLVAAPLEFFDDLIEHGHSISCSVFAARFIRFAATNSFRKTVRLQRCVLCHSSAALVCNAALE